MRYLYPMGAKHVKSYRERNKRLGLCVNHKRPAKPGRTRCAACLKTQMKWEKETDEARIRNGLCRLSARTKRRRVGNFNQDSKATSLAKMLDLASRRKPTKHVTK